MYIHVCYFCIIYILRTYMYIYMLINSGTPPRIDGRTIKYTFLEKQFGDNPPTPFSFLNTQKGIQVTIIIIKNANENVLLVYIGSWGKMCECNVM